MFSHSAVAGATAAAAAGTTLGDWAAAATINLSGSGGACVGTSSELDADWTIRLRALGAVRAPAAASVALAGLARRSTTTLPQPVPSPWH